MDYATFRAARAPLERAVDQASTALRAVPGISSGRMGLTPDDVRARPDFRAADQAYALADNRLRAFDRAFTKAHRKTWPVYFKREVRAELAERRAATLSARTRSEA